MSNSGFTYPPPPPLGAGQGSHSPSPAPLPGGQEPTVDYHQRINRLKAAVLCILGWVFCHVLAVICALFAALVFPLLGVVLFGIAGIGFFIAAVVLALIA